METLAAIEMFNGGYWITAVEGERGDSIETSTVTRGYIEGPFESVIDAKAAQAKQGY
jgi:hypothetical protein